jgi:very-short-patch-repair endonuclease
LQDASILDFVRELRFDKVNKRKWRFDFSFTDVKLAVEIEGGRYKSRHRSIEGFERDAEKYAEAVLQGWTVLRVPGSWVTGEEQKALQYTRRVLYALRASKSKLFYI